MALRNITKKLLYLLLFLEDNGLGIASEDRIGRKSEGCEFVHKINNKEYDCRVIGKGKLLCLLLLYAIILANR